MYRPTSKIFKHFSQNTAFYINFINNNKKENLNLCTCTMAKLIRYVFKPSSFLSKIHEVTW